MRQGRLRYIVKRSIPELSRRGGPHTRYRRVRHRRLSRIDELGQRHPNYALRQLAERIRPGEPELQTAAAQIAVVQDRLAAAFPRSRVVRFGSFSRGTAVAVHTAVDVLAVLPSEWATWGSRPVSPLSIIQLMAEDLGDAQVTTRIRRDCRAVELHFEDIDQAIHVWPGFLVRQLNEHAVYRVPGEGNQWIEVTPELHNSLFARANAGCGKKLCAISQLVKVWRYSESPPYDIAGFYVDMMLASSDIAVGIKSYAHCLSDFFKELVHREVRGLIDPAGVSGVITASPSSTGLERLYCAAKDATKHAQAAVEAQAGGSNAEAKFHWKAIFRRGV